MTRPRKSSTPKSSSPPTAAVSPEQVRAWGIPVGYFPAFLTAHKQWAQCSVFVCLAEPPFLAMKAQDYVWKVLRKRYPGIRRWDRLETWPETGSALLSVTFLVSLPVASLSADLLERHTQVILRMPPGLLWWVEGWPPWPESVWRALSPRVWVLHQPALGPADFPAWIVRLARAFRLVISPALAQRLATAVFLDVVPVIQAFENLAVIEPDRPLEWADVEPFLPATARQASAATVLPWVLNKDYDRLLSFVARLDPASLDMDAFLRQSFEQWRLWVLTGRMAEYEPAAWHRWSIGRRVYQEYHRWGATLTAAQWRAWAQEAARLEVWARKTDVSPAHLLAIGLLQWLRVLA